MGSQIPLGFGMALIQNEYAMQAFERLTEPEKQSVLQQARNLQTKAEMQELVSELARGGVQG